MRKLWSAALAALVTICVFGALPAIAADGPGIAGDYIPGDKNIAYRWFDTSPASMTANIYVRPVTGGGTPQFIGTVNASKNTATASAPGNQWDVNMSSVVEDVGAPALASYLENCAEAYVLVEWKPVGVNCVASACPVDVYRSGGKQCVDRLLSTRSSDSYVYASAPVAEQGITQAVMNYFSARGQLPIRWREFNTPLASHGSFSFQQRRWEVYRYNPASPPRLTCTVITSTNPNSSFPPPEFTECTGN
jgi:hypothetical protein